MYITYWLGQIEHKPCFQASACTMFFLVGSECRWMIPGTVDPRDD